MAYRRSTRIIALLLIVVALTMTPVKAYAATKWKTGCFGNGNSRTTVHMVYSEGQKYYVPFKGTGFKAKAPTLYFYSYSGNGKEKKGTTMYVQIQRWDYKKARWTVEYDYKVKDGQKIALKLAYPNKTDYANGWADVHSKNKWRIRIRRYSSYC